MVPTPSLPPTALDDALPANAARAPARFRDRARSRTGEQDLLVVRIGTEQFGIPLESVDELVEAPRLRDVPGAPPSLLGVFSHNGVLLPCHDPSHVLGATPGAAPLALVMRGGRRRIALAVDDAEDVVRVDLSGLRDAPRVERHDDVVVGVIWREAALVTVVDARALIGACETILPEGT